MSAHWTPWSLHPKPAPVSDAPPLSREKIIERLNGRYVAGVPHNQALGLQVTEYDDNSVTMRLPYDERLIGNPDTGVLHGGCITSLVDGTCGGAVIVSLTKPRRIATLDLRMDYVRPGRPGADIVCRAHCYKITRHVAFVRATAHDGDIDDPVATASGTFIVFREGSPGARKVKQG